MAAAVVLAASLTGCQQTDQALPFELAEGEGAVRTVGQAGGTVSVPPSFSIDFPQGALGSSVSVTVTPRVIGPFPDDEGSPVPGTAFDIGPVGTVLNAGARVEIAVDPALLEIGEDVRLAMALVRQSGEVVTFPGTFDVTNGVLVAEIDELGPVAAVVSADAISVALGAPPSLDGGAVPQPAPPGPSGPAPSSHGGVEFTASCSPEARQCFSSGIIRLWADDVVRQRLGDDMFLLAPSVEASLDFVSYDQFGIPTGIVGSISVDGRLRARLNSAVTRRTVDDGITTGPTTDPVETGLQISGNVMILSETTTSDGGVEFNEEIEFDVVGIGTSQMIVIEVEAEIDFDNSDGSTETGVLTAHVRLRR